MNSVSGRHILMTANAVGGVWQYALELTNTLTAAGCRVTLATLGPSPSAEQRRQVDLIAGAALVDAGLPLDWLADGPDVVHAAAARLAELAGQTGVDLVHCNSPALVSAAAWPVPVLAVAHGCVATWWSAVRRTPLEPGFAWHRASVHEGLRAADAVIAPSEAFAALLQQIYSLPFTPITVHNGRRAYPVPAAGLAHVEALTVGRLWDEAKNAATLDRAAGLARTPVIAAGALNGPGGEAFVPAHLRHMGQLGERQLAALLSHRPIFVSAAVFEPFGLAVLEAAIAGCALVLSDISVFRELWDGAALFVDSENAAGFAEAIDALAGDPGRRHELGRQAAERAARYNPEACAAQTAVVYKSLLAREEVAA